MVTGRQLTLNDMRRHLIGLSEAFGIPLVIHAAWSQDLAGADVLRRVVHSCDVLEETGYAGVLHEFGHLLHPLGSIQPRSEDTWGLTLAEEEAAWEWAEHYALDWTPAMEQARQMCLDSYRRGRAQREARHLADRIRAAASEPPRRGVRVESARAFSSRINWHS